MLKPLACAAILAAATPALASGPTPTDVAAFSAALAGMPSLDEMHREQASGDLRGFAAAMRRATDVATAVAERDYPQLGAGWEACRSHNILCSILQCAPECALFSGFLSRIPLIFLSNFISRPPKCAPGGHTPHKILSELLGVRIPP
jgi:hypothetical protein